MLLNQAVHLYMDDVRSHCREATVRYYREVMGNLTAVLGERDCSAIDQDLINSYVESRHKSGAGRRVVKELHALGSLLKFNGIPKMWSVPRCALRIPAVERALPRDDEFARLYKAASSQARLAIDLALFCGLRHAEAFRIRFDDVDKERGLLTIPAEIRKVPRKHVLPICAHLQARLTRRSRGPILSITKPQLKAELRRLSRRLKLDNEWSGLQPARRLLVTWGEEAGYVGIMYLITGHQRKDMTGRYTNGQGLLEKKAEIIAALESRFSSVMGEEK